MRINLPLVATKTLEMNQKIIIVYDDDNNGGFKNKTTEPNYF